MAWERGFTVPAPPDRAWEVFADIGALAECLPGLTGIEPEGSGVRARLRFRAGSNQVTYVGAIVPTGDDRPAGEFAVEAKGTEARGDGEVRVAVRIRLRPEGAGTAVSLAVTPTGSGRISGFDAAAVRDAGERLLDRFVAALGERFGEAVAAPELPAEAAPEPTPAPPAAEKPVEPPPVITLPEPGLSAAARRARGGAVAAVLLGIVAIWLLRRRFDG